MKGVIKINYKDTLRYDLERFRELNHFQPQHLMMKRLPSTVDYFGELFNYPYIVDNGLVMPCDYFGKHLVLKIIDELLDEGEENV